MRAGTAVLRAAIVCFAAAAARIAGAQTQCLASEAAADSARNDLADVMTSGNVLVMQLRIEQRIPADETGEHAPLVHDRTVCTRMAATLKHPLAPRTRITVLRMGSLYYVRDPDQRQSTGVIADSTFTVLMRLGRRIDDKS